MSDKKAKAILLLSGGLDSMLVGAILKRENIDVLALRFVTGLEYAVIKEELLEIYAYYVEKTAITFEYEVPSIEAFGERIHKTLKRYPYLVSEKDGRLAGYAYAGPFKERRAYDWSVETTIYIAKDVRGHGLGKERYTALEHALALQNVINLNACIAYPDPEDEYLTRSDDEI